MYNNNINNNQIDSFDDEYWKELFDYSGLLDDACWNPQLPINNVGVAIDASVGETTSQASDCAKRECQRKRGRTDQCGGQGTKTCRERMRREKLNDKFSELSAILEPGRPVKTDKLAILGDAIRALNQLKAESQEYKEMNEKLLEEIKTLKVEKSELREEKLMLKADKEKMEQQLNNMAIPPTGFMPPHPPVFHQAGANKMTMFPGYGFVPMWQYLPPAARDTAQDHQLRPPAA